MPSTSQIQYVQAQEKPGGIEGKQSGSSNIVTDDVFGDEEGHQIRYKTLSWQVRLSSNLPDSSSRDDCHGSPKVVSLLMIAEIVSNGMLSLPSALAVVGIVPAVILIIFLGVFALFTAKLLIDFKLNHPDVHNMGDAGYILFGPVGREILSIGTILFAICACGSELLSGQQALSTLSNQGLCTMYLLLIFAIATYLFAVPRTLGHLSFLGLVSSLLILAAGVIGMAGAGANPVPGRVINATISGTFYEAFLAITNPVFSYAGHFMFFMLMSEMRRPQDAMKAAWCLQGFATLFYVVFSVVMYIYIGNTVQSPAFFSLSPRWAKAAFGIALGNFLISGALYTHTAAKLIMIRFFRHSPHIHSHTVLGWLAWLSLCFGTVGVAFVLAIAVPIFSYLIGIVAALFASWYTYGVAGFFWLHDTYYLEGGRTALTRKWAGTTLAVLSVLLGAFICVAGTYVSIRLIVKSYASGDVGRPFTC